MEFCNLKAQYQLLKNQIDTAVAKTLEQAQFIQGEDVKILEKKCADFVGRKHAIAVASGTDALLVALLALGIGPNDAVMTTPFSFIAAAEMIQFLQAKPLFCDIDEKTYNIDPIQVERWMKHAKPKSQMKGIVAVDLFGQCADYEALQKIAKENDLFLIEDAAQSFGAEQNGKKACSFGDLAITSFFPSKPLGCYGDGGMIFTDSDSLAEKCRMFRNHGQKVKYEHPIIGLNSRLDTLQAAILLAKFDHFTQFEIAQRQKIADQYTKALQNLKLDITLPYIEKSNQSIWAQYSIQIPNRDKFKSYFAEKGIPTAIHYPMPLHLQEAFSSLGYQEGDFPISEKVAKQILSLPMSAYVTDGEIEKVVQAIKDFYS